MKRYFLLTSVLVLAACGGGSGGGGASTGAPVRAAMTPEARASNKEITQMASEILVTTDGSSSPVVQRSGTTNYQGKAYKSYRLDDVKFFTAENLNDETTPSFLKMELDRNGRINAIHMDVGGVASGRTVRDTTDTTLFQGPIFEYVLNGGDEALYRVVDNGSLTMADLNALAVKNKLKGGHWNRIDERLDIKTYGEKIGTESGSGDDIKLTYSDFGRFNPVYKTKYKVISNDEDIAIARAGTVNRGDDNIRTTDEFNDALAKEDYQLFAGGYAIKNGIEKDSLDPESGATFKGKAIGRVYTSVGTKKNGVDIATKSPYLMAYGIPKDASSDPVDHPEYKDTYSNNAGHDISKAFTTSEATMTISTEDNKIVQELYMPFHTANDDTSDKFYDITIRQKGNVIEGVDFAAADEEDIGSQYRKYDAFDTNSGGDFKYVEKANFHPGYYGIDTASEAAGTAQLYSKKVLDAENQINREYEVQAAWGMIKQ